MIYYEDRTINRLSIQGQNLELLRKTSLMHSILCNFLHGNAAMTHGYEDLALCVIGTYVRTGCELIKCERNYKWPFPVELPTTGRWKPEIKISNF